MALACDLPPARNSWVYLRDLPLEERRAAAAKAIKNEDDPIQRLLIRLTAENPGNLKAWVAP